MNSRSLVLPLLATSLACATGCAQKPAAAPVQAPSAQPTSAGTPSTKAGAGTGNVHVAEEIMRACRIEFNDVDRAPRFDFDQSALLPQDRSMLQQIAVCLTTGSLKGRAIRLVGRADPRGEGEYNMALGEHRAGTTRQYLANLGVGIGRIAETSRGKLDATGTDAAGWERDRRVDLLLQ